MAEHRQRTDDRPTIAICAACGKQAFKGGPLIPDETMVRKRWRWCAFGPGWSYCFTYDKYHAEKSCKPFAYLRALFGSRW